MGTDLQITFDCRDPARLAAFWAEALGYRIDPPPPGFDDWPSFLAAQGIPEERWNMASAASDPAGVGPRLFFQQVPEPKAGKNRVHLDLHSGGGRGVPIEKQRELVGRAVSRLEALGATKIRAAEQMGVYWVVMTDPEGNEFCA